MQPCFVFIAAMCLVLALCNSGSSQSQLVEPGSTEGENSVGSAARASLYEPSAKDVARLTEMLAPDYADFRESFPDERWVPAFRAANYDLDGDGVNEVLLRLDGRSDCGTGGCTLRIYRRDGEGFQKVSGSTLTWLPIGVLESAHQGWRDITVGIGGGGLESGPMRSILQYDGERYTPNPTTAPAVRSGDTGVPILTETSILHSVLDS